MYGLVPLDDYSPQSSTASSPKSPKVDEFGMWIIGDQLFVGYGLVHTVEDIIKLCRQTAQYIHVCPTISKTEELAKFVKVLEHRLGNIRSGSLEVVKDITNKRLRDLLLRCLERKSEICPLLSSSIEALLATASEASQALAAKNRDCFKQQLLETLRDFVILLQLVKNGKPVPDVDPLDNDSLNLALEWLRGDSSILSNAGFDAIRTCIRDGRRLAGILNIGVDKGELMAVCSEAELSAERFREFHCKGLGSGLQGTTTAMELCHQLSHLRDLMIESLSRKTLDDFMNSDTPIERMEKVSLTAHFKPQRDVLFNEKRQAFEEQCNNILTNINMCCSLRMIPNLSKLESIKYMSILLSALSPQVVWSARLLFSNPYNDALRDHFTKLKRAWLRKVEQLRALFLSAADLRTFQRHKDSRSYISRSTVSPIVKKVNFVSSVKVTPVQQTPPPRAPSLPTKLDMSKEQPSWESADKDLVLAARKLALIVCRLSYLARNGGFSREELIGISRDIVRACGIVSRLTKELATDCTDKHTQSMLMKFCERIPTFATQLKMVCTVKAATLGGPSGSAEDEQATEMLLENARNLMSSVRETVHTAAAASINIRVASVEPSSSAGLQPLEEESSTEQTVSTTVAARTHSDRRRRTLRAASLDLGHLVSRKSRSSENTSPSESESSYASRTRRRLGSLPSVMADVKNQLSYKDLMPADQEKIREHILRTIQLATIIGDFVGEFAHLYDSFSRQLQVLVNNYKQKTSDYSNEVDGTIFGQSSLKTAWEAVLAEIVTDARSCGEFSSKLHDSKCSRLSEIVQCKRLHMNEMFNFRKQMDSMLDKSEETLHKMRVELRDETHLYKTHHQHYTVDGSERRDRAFGVCAAAHNTYVLQLKSTNKLIEEYHATALPWILSELSTVHNDTCNVMNSTIQNLSLFLVSKAHDQANRYDGIFSLFKQVSTSGDMHSFVKGLNRDASDTVNYMPKPHVFISTLDQATDVKGLTKGEIIFNDLVEEAMQVKLHTLMQQRTELEEHIAKLRISVLTLENARERLLASNNFNQIYNNQIDICGLEAQLRQAKIRMSVINTQITSLSAKQKPATEPSESRQGKQTKVEGSMKTLWKKFAKKAAKKKEDNSDKDKSSNGTQANGSTSALMDAGIDITPQVTEELVEDEVNADPVYNLLKGASMLRRGGDGDSSGVSSMRSLPRQNTGSSRSSSPAANCTPSVSSVRPKQMLNRRMKSFSLDTPDAPKQVDQSTKIKSSSYTNNTCIPGGNLTPDVARRRQLMGLQRKGLSVDDQDGCSSFNDSNSSVYTSHSNSPRNTRSKPSFSSSPNMEGYKVGDCVVALIDIDASESGDLSLRAGDMIHLTDTSDPEWWSGTSSAYCGFFRSRYVLSVTTNQLIYKIIKPLYLSDESADVKLLRYQVVLDDGGGDHNTANIHTKDVKTGKSYRLQCPRRYLERGSES